MKADLKAVVDSGDDAKARDKGRATDRSCGKRCYTNKREVQSAKNQIMRRRRRRFRPKSLRYYYCERCFAWHLATEEKGQ